MLNNATTPHKFDTIPAVVFGCLYPEELKVILYPSVGLVDGGILENIPVNIIPVDCRMPNTLLWIQFDEERNIIGIWKREDS